MQPSLRADNTILGRLLLMTPSSKIGAGLLETFAAVPVSTGSTETSAMESGVGEPGSIEQEADMPTVFDKLNLKGQRHILVINAPASFESELADLHDVGVLRKPVDIKTIGFVLAFVTKQKEVDRVVKSLAKKVEGDALLWFAYPKGSSQRYTCEFNRDTGWDAVRNAGFDRVRQIAIDENWTALRFRRVEYIGAKSNAPRST